MQGDEPQGTLTSPSLIIKGKYITFLIGGGCDINLIRAELLIEGQVCSTSKSLFSERLWPLACVLSLSKTLNSHSASGLSTQGYKWLGGLPYISDMGRYVLLDS